ncbi:molybdenopterin-binding protein Mop [Gottschalkia acidurici 9a]|uniref:Molybdenopterin-binding protein Mop n=1 Tax=Gottschalkia acidurici (strain ATCC 7906 / DSM 604 / BCRC 14475 / CIP 104303 / KCTC 5404 / NCIMB 10678 / 9a) TaxID=1128398 RepID=K0AZL3_GOTA9|nr:TOBE domain-containing protein [Gottschalkia acidurici]AFS77806.1 molybdenopterin-binding protein Mop [Gottschalkia acidurici 9a]
MKISARNQLKGKVLNINEGSVNSEVELDLGNGQTIVSIITKSSVENLDIKVGDEVTAIIKASAVMLGK